ncbi:protein-disulfide reductase DsbD domain-containing protein [Rubritalea sp.]|uniref:protein-disulfide reductase DsbD domain-containing protein n=1 Tax=Rubritalea sp. TaxID=2109375 RepID=UPI003EF667CD
MKKLHLIDREIDEGFLFRIHMMHHFTRLITLILTFTCLGDAVCAGEACCGESASASELSNESVRIQLACDYAAVVPGQLVRVGFLVKHGEGYHTYWKQPGIVGYPMQMKFLQPKLEIAPEVDWDLPERVSMNGHPAHGFKRDVVHSFSLQVPEKVEGDSFVIEVDLAWMACATNCFPQNKRFHLEVPLGEVAKRSAHFAQLQEWEVAPLSSWEVSAVREGDWYEIVLLPIGDNVKPLEGVYLFSEDGQLTSSFVQEVKKRADGSLVLRAEASGTVEIADTLPCLLYAEKGLGAEKFVRIEPKLHVEE